ncbi:methyltransferase family protein [Pleurocapsa sp. PCC 7327]|uniref:class I SAM-dependent DNA methyltransferase n=1 Tax=Pleurocapsa sp. PCC 7327 TaxID=118163 RepID=UPI00029FF3FA|nr:class I SAM-dependent methyltransferase [Pleurocapsa sp. PCC 7327]AFY76777.1 methyltransferase family protein [Pleurocapsa sp. PCC 7327]
MSVFGNYARYYDLLYRDKDYAGEAQFVNQLLQTYAPGSQSILELGCGTGTHAILLAKEGYYINGVDLSHEMLQKAKQRLSQMSDRLAGQLELCQGDVREVRLNKQFDAVISLFHVVSYQSTIEDLRAIFSTVKSHLKPGGIFIFDCWYGPAVLTARPTVRVKRLEDEAIQVTRIAEPILYPNDNLVDVNYHVFIRDKSSGVVEEVRETHRMRYLFRSEVDLLLAEADLEAVISREWITDREPGFDTWGVYYVVRDR